MNGIWIAHPEYATYATKLGIALGRALFDITAVTSAENEHACSKATWAEHFRANRQSLSAGHQEKRGTMDACNAPRDW